MYPNFNAERARKGIKLETLAKAVKKSIGTISLKLNGKYPLTLLEAKQLKKAIGTDLPLEVLFSEEAI